MLPLSNAPALSASGTDPRRRYSIKDATEVEKTIPPFGRGFSRHSGVYRPMTLFLPKINEGCHGQPRTKRLPSLTQDWKSSYRSLLPVEGEIFFLTFPLYRSTVETRRLHSESQPRGDLGAIGDISPITIPLNPVVPLQAVWQVIGSEL